jgi:hypothetical protein
LGEGRMRNGSYDWCEDVKIWYSPALSTSSKLLLLYQCYDTDARKTRRRVKSEKGVPVTSFSGGKNDIVAVKDVAS